MPLILGICLVALVATTGCSNGGDSADSTSADPEDHPGFAVYRKYCRTCHQGGVSGSPIFGKKEDWEERVAKGRDVLLQNTIDGMPPAMPVKGLCMSCTDEELDEAIDYMLSALED